MPHLRKLEFDAVGRVQNRRDDMPSHDTRRPYKRPAKSDQERRRELSLQRQEQNRRDAQRHARCLASSLLSLPSQCLDPTTSEPVLELEEADSEIEFESSEELQAEYGSSDSMLRDLDVRHASKLRGHEARKWFAKQLMLPEWMIDVPEGLNRDWFVFSRPAGKRCFVVSSKGVTISRLRNGSFLHRFSSALPSGSRKKDISGSAQSYSILDCIFHEMDQTYYVIDMLCWRGYSLYDCTTEFRFFWLNSKLVESGACEPPSINHKYKFSMVPVYSSDENGLHAAYGGAVPYVKDGLLFYNKCAHYQPGNTPLALVWKDENCSQYVIDTDSSGQVPSQQQNDSVPFFLEEDYVPIDQMCLFTDQVVLELQDEGKVATSDDPPMVFGSIDGDFIKQSRLHTGALLRFAISDGALTIVNGKLEGANLHYLGKANRGRVFADSFSKAMFQYAARHCPLRIEDLLLSITSSNDQSDVAPDIEMVENQ